MQPIGTPELAADLIRRLIGWRMTEQECLVVIGLGHRLGLIDKAVLTTGSISNTIVDPAQILRWALTRSRPVRTIVIGHNHPSGDLMPSQADHNVTGRLETACRILGIPLADHLVVTEDGYTSFAELGYIVPVQSESSMAAGRNP